MPLYSKFNKLIGKITDVSFVEHNRFDIEMLQQIFCTFTHIDTESILLGTENWVNNLALD